MKKNNSLKVKDKGAFALCFFIGFLGFLLTWRSDFDYSGVRGFIIAFSVSFILYILINLLVIKKRKTFEKIIQVDIDEVTIKEISKGENVEINIIIPRSALSRLNNV